MTERNKRTRLVFVDERMETDMSDAPSRTEIEADEAALANDARYQARLAKFKNREVQSDPWIQD